MCGRTCLTLEPKDILQNCSRHAKDARTEYRPEYNLGKKYTPSHNIAPTDVTPVLVSAKHFGDETSVDARVLVPMMWGMVPIWHKGDYRKHGLSTNNCRLESMLESKMYSGPFKRGQRCVILCEGFYEWQTTIKTKKPSERAAHFLHMPQNSDDIKIYDKTTWNSENVNLLKMAGLYDIWMDQNGDKMYSYTVITFQSSELLTWLHDRMPAILENDQQVSDWLNFSEVTNEQALSVLRPAQKLCWYQVSNQVNNARNKNEDCNNPKAKTSDGGSGMLKSWLINSKRKVNEESKTEETKKFKPMEDKDEDDRKLSHKQQE